MSPASDKRLVILRPHKTGSTSLAEAIASTFRPEDVCPAVFMFQFKAVPEPRLRNYQLYWPHFTVEQGRRMFPDANFISIVRNPKKRLLSSYFYWRAQVASPNHPMFPHHEIAYKAAQMPLKEFLSSNDESVLRATDNYLTRFFGGGQFGEDATRRTQIYLPDGMSMTETYERALAAIDKTVAIIAVAEHMTQSLQAINRKFGMSINTVVEYRSNVTPKAFVDQPVDEECEARLDERLSFDMRLYECCVRKLEQTLSQSVRA
jgi:hypothetical protein